MRVCVCEFYFILNKKFVRKNGPENWGALFTPSSCYVDSLKHMIEGAIRFPLQLAYSDLTLII